jgi:predicted MFS family arabinose efflux permease
VSPEEPRFETFITKTKQSVKRIRASSNPLPPRQSFCAILVVISTLIWHSCKNRAAPDMPLSRNIVLLLCAGIVTITSIGMNSFSLFLRPIEAEFGWSRTTATVPYMFGMLGWAVGGVFFFGKWADDLGARKVILSGILLMAATLMGGTSQTARIDPRASLISLQDMPSLREATEANSLRT